MQIINIPKELENHDIAITYKKLTRNQKWLDYTGIGLIILFIAVAIFALFMVFSGYPIWLFNIFLSIGLIFWIHRSMKDTHESFENYNDSINKWVQSERLFSDAIHEDLNRNMQNA